MKLPHFRRHREQRTRGQALVEMAVMLPILLLLLLLAIDVGRVFFGWVALNNAARIAANGPLAIGAVRRIVAEVRPLTVADMAPLRAMAAAAQSSADAQEGRAAFLEKRPPRFQGR